MHRLFDFFNSPFGLIIKDIGGQIRSTFDANTAVTEVPSKPVEEIVGRRVVKVNIELIRKKKFHEPKRVPYTGLLSELILEIAGRVVPVDFRRINDLGSRLAHSDRFDILAQQIV